MREILSIFVKKNKHHNLLCCRIRKKRCTEWPKVGYKHMQQMGRGGCPDVNVDRYLLDLHSDDPSSNPAEVCSFILENCVKRTKINEKEAGDGPFNIKTCNS